MLYAWRAFGLNSAGSHFPMHRYPKPCLFDGAWTFPLCRPRAPPVLDTVQGFDNPVYSGLARKLSALDPGFRPKSPSQVEQPSPLQLSGDQGTQPSLPQTVKIRILAEGKTDYKHLKAALRFFQKNNQYLELEVD